MDDRTQFFIVPFDSELKQTSEQSSDRTSWIVTLGQAKNMAKLYWGKIALFDAQGFRKGTVFSDGSVQF